MKLKFLVGILVFLVVVNLAAVGTFLYLQFTKPEAPERLRPWTAARPGPARSPRLHHLPPEHRRELMELLGEFQEETSDLRTRVSRLEGETVELMQLDDVPAARVDSLLREISMARYEISRIAARKLMEAKAVLPADEQRVFFNAILEARPHRSPQGLPDRASGPRGRRPQRNAPRRPGE